MARVIDKVGLAFISGRRLLLVRNRGTSQLLMPGGRREGRESDQETLAREIAEETGATLDETSLDYVGEFSDWAANDPGELVRIRVYTGAVTGAMRPAAEVDRHVWFDPIADDHTLLSAIVKNKILPALQERRLL